MSVIREICDRVAVMYLGEIVEIGRTEELFANPQHPYTEALLSSIPTPDPRATRDGIKLTGSVPSPTNPPSGCRFHTRCHRVIQPEEFDLDQSEWRQLLTLRDQVTAATVDVEQLRESVRAEHDGEVDDVPDGAVEARIRTEFNLPEHLSDPNAERTLKHGLDRLVADDVDAAIDVLSTEFVTPCERTEPEFTDHEDGHRSACLRHREQRQSVELAADDD